MKSKWMNEENYHIVCVQCENSLWSNPTWLLRCSRQLWSRVKLWRSITVFMSRPHADTLNQTKIHQFTSYAYQFDKFIKLVKLCWLKGKRFILRKASSHSKEEVIPMRYPWARECNSRLHTSLLGGLVLNRDSLLPPHVVLLILSTKMDEGLSLSLIHIWRCRRIERCRSRWSPYH